MPLTFNQTGYQLATDLPDEMRPWRDRPVAFEDASPATGTYHLDADGVYKYYAADGGVYDHPVGQAQFALGCLASYRTETDPARQCLLLTRARTQADRLIAQHVEARGAWWFPYPFPFTHTVHTGVTYTAPWFSGMAQGEVLSLFVQLAQVDALTADERAVYMAAAAATFASLQVADDGSPWAVNVGGDGFVWIQEYPASGTGISDYTFNGMIFAMFGLYDYYCATGSAEAAALYDGCATTIAANWPLLRNPKWASFYCKAHRIPAPTYHQHHIELMLQLNHQTGSADFAEFTDRLVDDYPARVSGTVAFQAGSHTLYRFDTAASGAWVAAKADAELDSKTVTFSQDTAAPTSMRRRIQGRGIYYLISAGAYAGWWVGESWSKAFLRGEYLTTVYRPARTVTFPGGSVPVDTYRVAADGTVLSVKTVSFASPSTAPTDRRAVVNGRPMFQITEGGLTDYWVPATAVTVESDPA
jgi:hypothetical protein